MIGVPVLIMALWQSDIGRIVLFVVGGLVALDLALGGGLNFFFWVGRVRGLFRGNRQSTPRDYELKLCSRAAGVLAVAARLLWQLAGWREVAAFLTVARTSPDWEHGGAVLAVGGALLLASVFFVTGARRSLLFAGERDARRLAFSAVKIALGVGLWLVWNNPPADWAAWAALLHSVPYSTVAIMALATWLAATGVVKFGLVAWGGHRAHRLLNRILTLRNAPLVPARARRWPFNGWPFNG
jgi:hypothetical protein